MKRTPLKGKLTALGVTCGIGSMLIGARRAGFNVVGNIEWRRYYHDADPQGRNTFTANFPGAFFPYKMDELSAEQRAASTGVDLIMGHPECLPGSTNVYTTKGWRHIESIVVGEQVLTHRGRFRKVLRTYRNQVPVGTEVVELRFFEGRSVGHVTQKLVITPDHPVLVDGRWKLAKDVRDGDSMSILGHPCAGCGTTTPFYQKFCCVSCSAKHQWSRASPQERAQLVEAAHKETRRLARSGQHHFFDPKVRSKAMRALAKGKNGSWLERRMRWALMEIGIPTVPQYQVGRFFLDMAVPKRKIGIECDGLAWHRGAQLKKDALRDVELRARGWTVLRFPELVLNKDLRACAEEVRRVLMNHDGLYRFTQIRVTEVIHKRWKAARTVCNLGVEEDESYTAKGYVVHNCGNFSGLNANKEARHDPGDIPLFVDMVAELRPRFFVMDDLPKSFIAYPMQRYEERLAEYDLFPEWVSNYHYGNVQRQRKRMFMIGALKKEGFTFRAGEFAHERTVKDVIGDLLKKEGRFPNHDEHALDALCAKALHLKHHGHRATWREMRDYVLDEMKEGAPILYHGPQEEILTRVGSYKGHWEGPAHVLTGGISGFHPIKGVPYSVRERARLQGFPDDFIFYGTVLDEKGRWNHDKNMHMVKQTGKAMPIQFCEYAARQIRAHIDQKDFKTSGERLLAPDAYISRSKMEHCERGGYGKNQAAACEACWMRNTCHMSVFISESTRKELQDGFRRHAAEEGRTGASRAEEAGEGVRARQAKSKEDRGRRGARSAEARPGVRSRTPVVVPSKDFEPPKWG